MATLYRYRLPFHRTFHSGGRSHAWSIREGAILRFRTGSRDLLAEAAPLPGFSRESLPETLKALEKLLPHLSRAAGSRHPSDELDALLREPLPPSVAFAISALSLQLGDNGPDSGRPALNKPAGSTTENPAGHPAGSSRPGNEPDGTQPMAIPNAERALPVNGVADDSGPDATLAAIRSLAAEGYRTIKLKCGADAGPLIRLLELAAGELPHIRFRVDANRSWNPVQAVDWLERLSALPVEYCEEPCPFTGPEEASLLRNRSPLPIALDESLHSVEEIRTAARTGACDVVILKPSLLGSLHDQLALAGELRSMDPPVEPVITTALESGIGRTAIARLALLAGSTRLAHGLDTGRMFEEDLTGPGPAALLPPEATSRWAATAESCNTDLLIPYPQ